MPTDYGRCISVTDDLPRRWKYQTGPRVVAEALIRRWSTPRGSLPSDPDYGDDVRGMIGDALSQARIAEWQSRIQREAEKDDRVEECTATVSYSASTATATIAANIATASGTFTLVVAVSDLTVALLQVS